MSLTKTVAIVLGSSLMLGATSLSAAPTGQMLADTCAGCHGTDGGSTGPATPSIAGNAAYYIVEAMNAYKSGDRHSTIMGRIAKGYSDDEIEAMAEVIASWPLHKTDQQVDADKVAMGSEVYEDACVKCHDEKGSLADDEAGILYSQWLPYLTNSIEDFKAGHREMPKKMKKAVEKLSDEQIDAVNHFFASQK
ncbi:MAG: c-type cytochrome [Gammaproteobacteria bacterium]